MPVIVLKKVEVEVDMMMHAFIVERKIAESLRGAGHITKPPEISSLVACCCCCEEPWCALVFIVQSINTH